MTDLTTTTDPPLTVDALKHLIEEESGLDIDQLSRTDSYKWFTRRTATEAAMFLSYLESKSAQATDEKVRAEIDAEKNAMWDSATKPIIFSRGKAHPLNDALVIWEIFQDEEELRVYTVPKEGAFVKLARYRMSKSQPNFGVESMVPDTWISAVAAEWQAIDGEENPADNEREAVIDYMKAMPKDYSITDLIDDIEEELHLVETGESDEDPEETEETEDTEQEAAANGAAAVATTEPATAATT
jgi:hypothetical protein